LHEAGPRNKEWHAAFAANDQLQSVCSPYLTAAALHGSGILVDVGCGSSSFGEEILQASYGYSELLLLDACQSILAQKEAGGVVELVQADCRCLPLRTQSVTTVLDKGTLDALWSDEDKVCMLEECARVLEPDGLIISVSFSSPARLLLLAKHTPRLGLHAHIHVIGADPARGHEARFVCLLAKEPGQSLPSYTPSLLTQKVLLRLRRTGSLLDEDHDEEISPIKQGCDLEGIASGMEAARARAPVQESGFKLFDD